MNQPTKLLPVLAASLSLLALPALAQSSGSTDSRPSTIRSDRDQRPAPPESTGTRSGSTATGADSSTRGSDLNSRAQVNASGGVLFDQLDSDRDGRISQMEYTQSSFNQSGVSGKGSVSAQGSAGGVTPRTGAGNVNPGGQNPAEIFRQLDTNRDGYLSREELYAGQSSRIRGSQPAKP